MYSHILKCKFVPTEQLHPEVWKGANRRFKRTPWNRIERKRLRRARPVTSGPSVLSRSSEELAKADKLKALGYEIDLPQLKSR